MKMKEAVASEGMPAEVSKKGSALGGNLILLVVVGAIILLGVLAYEYSFQTTPPPTSTVSGSNSTTGGPSLMQATCASLPKSNVTVEHVVSGGNGDHAYFLIVEADPPSSFAGINGSYYVNPTTQWPVLNVKLGQVVSIHVINCASSESHGFQITHYDDISKNLISIGPGQSYDVTFTANTTGTFRVYCGIFCSIHPLMQNGALVVS